MRNEPLIAPKPIAAFTPDEYHTYVGEMYELRQRGSSKPKSPAPGLSITRTKKGELSVRRTAKTRPFAYATYAEIEALAKAAGTAQSDVWNLLKRKKFILAQTRIEAEHIYGELNNVPF